MKHLKAFIEFIREQGVVGLAVGFILGGAVSKLVASFVSDMVNPLIGLIFGSREGLLSEYFQLRGNQFMWGNFIGTAIDFIVIALVVYFGVRLLGLDRLDKKKS